MNNVLETKRVREIKRYIASLNGAEDREAVEAMEQAEKDSAVLIERDHVPVEVATEMLCVLAGQGRMTNRQRKTFMAAREKHYAAQTSPVPGSYKLAAKFRTAELTQLGKWLNRAIHLKKNIERAKTKPALLKHPKVTQLLGVLAFRLSLVTETIDLLEVELKSRR
jgi:hypothetical protein